MAKISVLMSVYKEDDALLRKSIESVLTQTYQDFEFFVVDDGASETNIKLLMSFDDPRLKIVKNTTNIGLTKSLNKAASLSSGEYLARIDSDDFCELERFEKQIAFLDSNNSYGLCGAKENPEQILYDDYRSILCFFNPFVHSTLMIRRSSFEKIGGYDETYRFAQDYDLVFRLSQICKLKILDEVLVKRTMGAKNISVARNKEQLGFALKTRKRAFAYYGGSYSKFYLKYFKSLLGIYLPSSLVNFLRKLRS